MKHYIIAGRYEHARLVKETFTWSQHDHVYVKDSRALAGVNWARNDIYIYAPTYRDHPHFQEIMCEVDWLRRHRQVQVHWVYESELCVNRLSPAGSVSEFDPFVNHGYPPEPVCFRTTELRNMIVPADKINGFRIHERAPGTVTIVSIEPTNPNDRNAPWMVWYQERS